jgi:hypothetical protein
MSSQALQQALAAGQAAEQALAAQYRAGDPLSVDSWKRIVLGTLELQAASTAFAQEMKLDDSTTSAVLDAIR